MPSKHRYLLILFVVFTSLQSTAQTYSLNSSLNGQTISTCSGVFYDSSIPGNYSNNEDYTVTFCPSSPGKVLRIDFSLMELAFYDNLTVYDGADITAPVITNYDYLNANTRTVVAKNSSGCLTFRFRSDGTSVARGWQGVIKCVPPCQEFTGALVSVPAADENGVVTVCLGSQVSLTANISYPYSGNNYTQGNALSKFYWRTGFSHDTSATNLTTITKTITQHAGYRVTLSVTDSNGCSIDQVLKIKVRTSSKPNFRIAQPPSLCMGDTTSLSSSPEKATGSYIVPPFSGNSLFLPDGTGITYSDTIRITDFTPGQTLTNVNDFLGVFLTMEHSYLGDLDMKLTAPNGTTIILKQTNGGGGTQLGEPVDFDNQPNVPGVGYLYGFTPNPSHNTMVAEANLYTYSYTDVLGNTYNNRRYLPAGNYTPYTTLSNLIGTPLNGNWIISITDHLNSDNGYIFNWQISFDKSIYPNVESYSIGIKDLQWQPAPGLFNAVGAIAKVSPLNAGSFYYTLRITDSADCFYDSSVLLITRSLPPKPLLGADKVLCADKPVTLNVSNPVTGVTYMWNTGTAGTSLNVLQQGEYNVNASNVYGCSTRDTIQVINDVPISISIAGDDIYCASATHILQAAPNANVTAYVWSDGSHQPTLQINNAGTYWVEGSSNAGCKTRDTLIVTSNPINNWTAPNDSSICGSDLLITLLNYPAGTNFLWSDGNTANTRHFTADGDYEITAQYNGCIKKDSLKVRVYTVPTVNLGIDTMFCASHPNILQAAVTGNIKGYTWSNGQTTSSLPINAIGTYWLEVMTDKNCKAVDSIIISNNPINNWLAPDDSTTCGTSITLPMKNYPAGTNFLWNDGGNEAVKTFTGPGLYTVVANYKGCLRTDDINIGINPVPIVDLGSDLLFCNSSANILQANITGTITSLEWNTGATTNPLSITGIGTYWLEARTQYGCKHRDTINVTFNPINSWQALADSSICDETTYTAIMKNYPPGTNFLWYDGNTSVINSFTKAGDYAVTVNYKGCDKKDTVSVTVRPLPIIELGKDSTICNGFTIPLKASYPGATYLWSNGKTDSIITSKTSGNYWVKASYDGCSYIDFIKLDFVDCDCHLSIPTAFSPNNDGVNDVLRVHIECYPQDYSFMAFDRYGRKVFETRDFSKGWNGQLNGKPLPIGTYYYILSFYNSSLHRNEQKTGYVVLLK